ncbi:MAG: ATP-grasp domain-containing protein [Firmicutes bacterium]|nr:ATP-grasp domain-containing protein [Bacillota bacterium]
MTGVSLFKKFIGSGSINTKHVWWLNIGAESVWGENHPHVLPQVTYKGNTRTVNRTEQLCLLLASEGDIVIQREKPSDVLLDHLQGIGFGEPEIYVPESYGSENGQCSISELILRDEKLLEKLKNLNSKGSINEVELAPYAITRFEEEISLRSGCKLIGAAEGITAWVNNKTNARILAEELGLPVTEGYICHTVEEAKAAVDSLKNNPCVNRIVVKEAYGASGKGMFIVDSEKDYQLLMVILGKNKNKDKRTDLIVERWHDTLIDLNYQIYIHKSGRLCYIPPKRQINKGSVYIGSEFPLADGLTDSQRNYYEECAIKIGRKLWEKGYYGFASIDSIITGAGEGVIIPIVEINGRFSLSTYVSFIPGMLGNDKAYRSRYYYLKPGTTIERIAEDIRVYSYTREKGEGVIICSFAEGDQDISEGRLFSIFVAEKRERLDYLEERFVEELYYLILVKLSWQLSKTAIMLPLKISSS